MWNFRQITRCTPKFISWDRWKIEKIKHKLRRKFKAFYTMVFRNKAIRSISATVTRDVCFGRFEGKFEWLRISRSDTMKTVKRQQNPSDLGRIGHAMQIALRRVYYSNVCATNCAIFHLLEIIFTFLTSTFLSSGLSSVSNILFKTFISLLLFRYKILY